MSTQTSETGSKYPVLAGFDPAPIPPRGANISGLESDGGDRFFCGGQKSGKVRVVRRPKGKQSASKG